MLDQFIVAVKSVIRPATTVAEEIILEEAQRYNWASVWEAKQGLRDLAVALGCSLQRADELATKHAENVA